MSDGIHRIAGVGQPITIDGVEYRTSSQITLGWRAEIEAYILSRRPSFMKTVADSLKDVPKEYHDKILAEAVRRQAMASTVFDEEVECFLNTLEGVAFFFWLAVRENHPEIKSAADALAIVSKIELSDAADKLAEATGLHNVKN